MRLWELLCGMRYKMLGASDKTEITHLTSDSRKVSEGSLFVCIKGSRRDGHDYAEEAVRRGAVAVVAERYIEGVPSVIVKNTRAANSLMWYRLCGCPDEKMVTCAVTGTNGKTSTAAFLAAILSAWGLKTAVIGTLGFQLEGAVVSLDTSSVSDRVAAMTTPDPEILYPLLKEAAERGCEAVVMEVSSHAIGQKKTAPIHFDCGIFTNLSEEHLDYHASMEAYYKTKASLFRQCRRAAVATDCGYGRRLRVALGKKAVGVSTDKVRCLSQTADGISYVVRLGRDVLYIKTGAGGLYNVQNTLLAASAARMLGIDAKTIERGLGSVSSICGRLERVASAEDYGIDVYIDYAHTPEAMKNTLCSLRQMWRGRPIAALFGCGGDRDRSKRAAMGSVAEKYADTVVITSDNPRCEDRSRIIGDILCGISCEEKVTVIENRRLAIEYLIENAEEKSVVVCLGKGHENYETDREGKHPFSEKEIIAESLARRKRS